MDSDGTAIFIFIFNDLRYICFPYDLYWSKSTYDSMQIITAFLVM